MGGGREAHHREGAQVGLAEPRLEPADQRFVNQDGIEVHGHFGDADPMTPGRDAGMQISQRARRRDLKDRPLAVFSALRSCAIEVAVGALDQRIRYWIDALY